MDIKRINRFLSDVAANNNRAWFLEHKAEYTACRAEFERGVTQAIAALAQFDPSVGHLTVKDCTYRFNRDTRFSEDKSPYKNHFGAYICAKGKKSLRGGYYIHVEPGACLLAVGSYWLPTNILTACRNEISGNVEAWRQCVETADFIENFGRPAGGMWDSKTGGGFGLAHLKTAPKGFPRDSEVAEYLRMKDYVCWKYVPDTFYEGEEWMPEMSRLFRIAKPMMDFTNEVIDDYE